MGVCGSGGGGTKDAGDVILYTDKKEKKIFLIYKEIQKASVKKSYMIKYLHISSYIRKPFLIFDFATDPI